MKTLVIVLAAALASAAFGAGYYGNVTAGISGNTLYSVAAAETVTDSLRSIAVLALDENFSPYYIVDGAIYAFSGSPVHTVDGFVCENDGRVVAPGTLGTEIYLADMLCPDFYAEYDLEEAHKTMAGKIAEEGTPVIAAGTADACMWEAVATDIITDEDEDYDGANYYAENNDFFKIRTTHRSQVHSLTKGKIDPNAAYNDALMRRVDYNKKKDTTVAPRTGIGSR